MARLGNNEKEVQRSVRFKMELERQRQDHKTTMTITDRTEITVGSGANGTLHTNNQNGKQW